MLTDKDKERMKMEWNDYLMKRVKGGGQINPIALQSEFPEWFFSRFDSLLKEKGEKIARRNIRDKDKTKRGDESEDVWRAFDNGRQCGYNLGLSDALSIINGG